MFADYFSILLFLIMAVGMGVALIVAGGILGPRNPSDEKLSPYACGFEPVEDARLRFDVRFYLIAILFIIFDLEIAFMCPWAAALAAVGLTGLLARAGVWVRAVVGFVDAWKKGALEWE